MDDFRSRGTHTHNTVVRGRLQKSTTLDRRYTKKPVTPPRVVTRAEKEREAYIRRQELANKMNRERLAKLRARDAGIVKADVPQHPLVASAEAKRQTRANSTAPTPKRSEMTAQELKEQAIQRAMAQMDRSDRGLQSAVLVEKSVTEAIDEKRRFWQSRRFVLAVSMSLVAVALMGYFVHLNMPDISVKVAASRVGIEGAYPSYIPKGYALDGTAKENMGKVELVFKNESHRFTVIQEKSAWDSVALFNNFVQKNWGATTVVLREHGLTIYVNGSDATWVNGGVRFTIDDMADGLSKQQLRDIAVSL